MKKIMLFISVVAGLCACDKHDPILPGERHSIFQSEKVNILNISVPNVPDDVAAQVYSDCPYRQDVQNTVWDGERKIFAGFATSNYVVGEKNPICKDGFVYAGLSTGELVKVNAKTRQIAWIADVYRQSNMTGGASVLDIVAPIQIYGKYVYAGGLGGAFCKISDATGAYVWCIDVGVEYPFVIVNEVAYVLDLDGGLNAVRLRDGAVYWRVPVKKAAAPTYANKIVTVGKEKFDAETGAIIN